MSVTVATVEAMVQKDFPDVPTTDVLEMLQEVCDELAQLYPLKESSQTFSSLVADTATYNFSTVPASVRSAVYKPSATASSWFVLRATNIDELNSDYPRWQMETSAQPTRFYTTSDATNLKLGLFAPPNETSSAGYPAVTVFTWEYFTLSTNMPVTVVAATVFRYGACYRFALRLGDNRTQFFKAMYEEAKRTLHKQTLGINVNATSKFTPIDVVRPSRTV